MKNECSTAMMITTIACQLYNCMDHDELSLLAVDLVQLSDTLVAMLAREDICNKENN